MESSSNNYPLQQNFTSFQILKTIESSSFPPILHQSFNLFHLRQTFLKTHVVILEGHLSNNACIRW